MINQPKDFDQDKDQLTLQLPEEIPEPENQEEPIPDAQTEPEQTAQTTEQKEPEETPRRSG